MARRNPDAKERPCGTGPRARALDYWLTMRGPTPECAEVLGLLNRGLKTYAFFSASTVLLEAEIERLGAALREVLAELRPVVAEEFPELLRPAERVG